MAEQLQVALGLKNSVKSWCFSSSPHEALLTTQVKDVGEPGLHFLDQLLLLGSIKKAEAAPIPMHLLLEEAAGDQDWRSLSAAGDAALTPSSCSGGTTFRSSRGSYSRSNNTTQEKSLPVAYSEYSRGCCSASTAAAQTSKDACHSSTIDTEASACQQGQASVAVSPPTSMSVENLDDSSREAFIVQECEKPLLPLSTAKQIQARCITPTAPVDSGAAAGPPSAGGQQKQDKHRLPSNVIRRTRQCKAAPLVAKTMKRRTAPQGAFLGTSREGKGATAEVSASAPMAKNSTSVRQSVRSEGPPQKRQAIVCSREELSGLDSSNSGAMKGTPGGLQSRRAPVVRSSSGALVNSKKHQSCRKEMDGQAKPEQKPLEPQRQHTENPTALTSGRLIAMRGSLSANAAAAASVAVVRCNSSNSAEDPVTAFAAQWLLGCQERLRAEPWDVAPYTGGPSTESPSFEAGLPDFSSICYFRGDGDVQKLQLTKKKLKEELKAYNVAFASHFGRQPLKQDKEALRPVYMYYHLIKQTIEQLVAAEVGQSTDNVVKIPTDAAPITLSSMTADRPLTMNGTASIKVRSPTSCSKRLKKNRSVRSAEGQGLMAARRMERNGGSPGSPGRVTEKRGAKISAYERQEQLQKRREEMTAQLRQLQRERRVLGDKLAEFRIRFKEQHGRPLRLKADIEPVQEEYKLFVETTKQIDALAIALQKQEL
ncbi:uncharacterized protein LOC34620837 [Cyclospora cayetanensis]|uniref:Uncharacterized protein LOC34620837 n=1 Tax=Cyclospora cayetanensis TaxID=88456 RepID=A0A6P6S0Y5_9EIME|nr:uncharacterized protein LOC34620837 [Cyclospora cayetanensis]